MDISSEEEFKKKVLESQIPVFVDFWAEWCGPCKMIAPVLEELAEEYKGKVSFVKLNVDDLPEISARYGVQSIPTLIAMKGGEIVTVIVGAHQKAHYVREINKMV